MGGTDIMQRLEQTLAVFNYIITFMTINVYTFLVAHWLEPQMVEPTNSCWKQNESRKVAGRKQIIIHSITE